MANNAWRMPANTAVAQVKTFTITAASTLTTAVWTLTLTLDNGDTVTVTYTEDGTPTVTEIATGLFNAWNASTNPHMAAITAANPSAGVFTLTADTTGKPFSVALEDNSDGTHTEVDTTANVGNNDYGTARNWQLDAIPVATNDVLFDVGSVDVLYGLNQSAVALEDFRVFKGCSSKFGRFDNGLGHYLRIDPNLFSYEGNGQRALFDLGAAAIAAYIASFGSPESTGRHTVYLKGSGLTTVEIARGNVGLAPLDGDTATIATVLCGFLESPASDVDLTIGSGVTLTTLTQTGGRCLLKCAATTVNLSAGAVLTTEGSGAIGTLNCYGTCYANSTGTITTANVFGLLDLSRDKSARTITTVVMKDGGRIILHSGITVTNWTALAAGGTFTVEYRD